MKKKVFREKYRNIELEEKNIKIQDEEKKNVRKSTKSNKKGAK